MERLSMALLKKLVRNPKSVTSYQQCLFWLFQHMVKYPHYFATDTRDANFDKGSIKLDLKDIDLKRLSFEIERERYHYACGVNKEEYINCGKYRKEKFFGNQQVISLTPQDSLLVVGITGGLLLNWCRLCVCKTCCFIHRVSWWHQIMTGPEPSCLKDYYVKHKVVCLQIRGQKFPSSVRVWYWFDSQPFPPGLEGNSWLESEYWGVEVNFLLTGAEKWGWHVTDLILPIYIYRHIIYIYIGKIMLRSPLLISLLSFVVLVSFLSLMCGIQARLLRKEQKIWRSTERTEVWNSCFETRRKAVWALLSLEWSIGILGSLLRKCM